MESEQAMERVRYRFVGRVQRRGFRFACMMAARNVGAVGWVRNEADGTVTAEVQTTAEGQLRFVTRLTTIVPGHGDNWSIRGERSVDLVDGEPEFAIRRY